MIAFVILHYNTIDSTIKTINSIIENINVNPNDYLIKLEKGTKEKDVYINSLLDMFSEYLNKRSNNRYVDIVNSMKNWIQSLSLYAQNHKLDIISNKNISDEILKLRRELVKYEINYRSFTITPFTF